MDGDADETARNISYDNNESGLEAINVQQAIDKLAKGAGGGGGSSSNIVYLTQAEYDALPEDKLEDNIEYWITDAGVRGSAENVSYDASASGLDAKNVQEAVDKLAEGAGNKVEYLTQEEYDALPEDKLTNNVEYRILDSGTPTTARNVGYDGTASGLDAVNVQGAIDKMNDSLMNTEISEITFANTITVGANSIAKIGNLCIASFEFSINHDYIGNGQLGTLGIPARFPSYDGFVWIATTNGIASVYVNENAIYMQTLTTIPANTVMRGGICYFA